MKHDLLSTKAQFAEVADKIIYLQSYALSAPLNEETEQEMSKWFAAAQAAPPDEATAFLTTARNLYFDLFPFRRDVEQQLLDDHTQARGKPITASIFSMWREGARTFEELTLEPPTRATIQDTDLITWSWDAADGEDTAFCVPVWRVTPDEAIPFVEGATFIGVSGIHRSTSGQMFDPARSEEQEYIIL